MRPAVLDKIASVTRNCRLARDVRLADEIRCREGDVVAVRILSRKTTYNQLELTTGRFCVLKPGDVIAGALGHRRALSGYAGHIPEALQPGDPVHLLNLGGVLGVCDSVNPDVGAPFECEVLGQVLHFPYLGERVGVPASIQQGALPVGEKMDLAGIPVVAVVGTCMDSGKTLALSSLIQEFVRQHLHVRSAKATGVSLLRDVLQMEDAGARGSTLFTDFGVVTTTRHNAAALARSMLTHLAKERPDLIVMELGDGILGSYGVDAILEDAGLRQAFSAVVLAANDPVGAWGGLELLRERFKIDVTAVTGPATDNAAGSELITARMGVPAVNARTDPTQLAAVVQEALPDILSKGASRG